MLNDTFWSSFNKDTTFFLNKNQANTIIIPIKIPVGIINKGKKTAGLKIEKETGIIQYVLNTVYIVDCSAAPTKYPIGIETIDINNPIIDIFATMFHLFTPLEIRIAIVFLLLVINIFTNRFRTIINKIAINIDIAYVTPTITFNNWVINVTLKVAGDIVLFESSNQNTASILAGQAIYFST